MDYSFVPGGNLVPENNTGDVAVPTFGFQHSLPFQPVGNEMSTHTNRPINPSSENVRIHGDSVTSSPVPVPVISEQVVSSVPENAVAVETSPHSVAHGDVPTNAESSIPVNPVETPSTSGVSAQAIAEPSSSSQPDREDVLAIAHRY